MFQVEQHLQGPMANLHNTTETTTTGSHRGNLRQGLMKDTTRGTHLLHSHQHPHSFLEALSKSLLQIAGKPVKDNRGNEGKSRSTSSSLQGDDTN